MMTVRTRLQRGRAGPTVRAMARLAAGLILPRGSPDRHAAVLATDPDLRRIVCEVLEACMAANPATVPALAAQRYRREVA